MARKELLAELLAQAYQAELAYAAGLTDEEKARVGTVGDWSAKDAFAHVAVWKAYRIPDMQAVIQGGHPTQIEDFDHENALIFERYRDKSWQEILASAAQAYQALVGQLEAMSEAELEMKWDDERPLWRLIVGNGYIHPFHWSSSQQRI